MMRALSVARGSASAAHGAAPQGDRAARTPFERRRSKPGAAGAVVMRIVVAGDIRLYRDGLALHLAGEAGLGVAGVAADRPELMRRVHELRPAIVVLDMAMAESLEAVRDLWREAPEVRVVAVTVPELEHAVIACAEAGIAGYVPREGSLDDLKRTIDSVARGESIVSPRMAASLLRRVSALAADRAAPARLDELTLREREIVELIRDGLSNKQIAARLNIELATAKNHVHRILEKLHVTRRGEIASLLRRQSPKVPELVLESWSRPNGSTAEARPNGSTAEASGGSYAATPTGRDLVPRVNPS